MNDHLPHNADDANIVLFVLWTVVFLGLWVWAYSSYQIGVGVLAAAWTVIPVFVKED
jgi:hypothetical protein